MEERRIKRQLEALDKMPERIEKGTKLIYPQREMAWKKMVRESVDAFFEGMDIDSAIEIMEILANNNDANKFETAIKRLDEQGHSGTSYWVVMAHVLNFSKEGVDFYKEVARKTNKTITEEDLRYINNVEAENAEFEAELNGIEKE